MRRAAIEKPQVNLLAVLLAAIAATPVHLPASTNDTAAQAAIDRGLFLYYAYNGSDAAAAFEEASRLDPQLATAYWGIALAEGPDLNTPLTEEKFDLAAAAMKKATSLAAAASPLERRLISAMAMRYAGTFAQWSAGDAAYRRAMTDLAQSSRDENAELLAAEALLEHGGLAWQSGTLTSEESRTALTLVDDVLQNDPNNVMANHLCIHLYDLATDRAPARPCAQRLDADAFPPEAEHLAHMPAHYWIETGDYAAALRSSERAHALMNQLVAGSQNSQHVERYARHDIAVGYSAAMMLGSYAVAQLWSQRMASAYGTSFDAITALRFGRYAAAYAANGNGFGGLAVRGLAALHLQRTDEARALAAHIKAGVSSEGYLPQLFLGELTETDGNYDEGDHWIEEALRNQEAAFSGELIPLLPAGEALGNLRLRRGDGSGAIAAFSATLTAYPDDPRALFGLAQAYGTDGASAQAAAARAGFQTQWEGADTNVTDALP
jgi:hypothetical protein